MSLVVDRTGPRLYVPTLSARPPESSKRETDYAGLTGRNVQLILYTGTLPYHFDRQKTKGKLDSFLVFFYTKQTHTHPHTEPRKIIESMESFEKKTDDGYYYVVCVCAGV